MTMLNIEKNVAYPKHGVRSILKNTAEAMQVGDSVVCKNNQSAPLCKYIAEQHGEKDRPIKEYAMTKKVDDNHRRVWRIK
jgi:hypothetical protein